MLRFTLLLLIAVGLVGFGARYIPWAGSQMTTAGAVTREVPKESSEGIVLASPGRIEGRTENLEIGAAIDGVVQAIHVRQGQKVLKGALLAEIGCDDLQAALQVATSEAEGVRQVRVRLLRGSREEQRQAAGQRTAAARAVLAQASVHRDRMEKLHEAGVMAKAVLEQAQHDHEVAQAELKRASRDEELVNAPALAEEVARADADVQAAERRIQLAEDKLAKCAVRAPIDGTVLRIHLRTGESFSSYVRQPLFTMADLSARRVRAEVDERDVGKVQRGQRLVVLSESHSGERFVGTVTQLSPVMGKKSVLTGQPAEKTDRDVLEIVAELTEEANVLPVGLRVTAQFLRGTNY
jgi:HlyD family secretion protein